MLERIEVLVNDSASTISVYLFELKLSSNFYVYLNKLSINYARIILMPTYAVLVFMQEYTKLIDSIKVLSDSDGACRRVLLLPI